ncbi:MAG: Holliday junction resolvase RuvX [Sphingobacteriia bacterium]|nr:Holliday junction resolvase RuvX [Sphingobacteriia bacterium]
MGRILAIDYGQKRVGVAVTDELQISANAIGTFHVKEINEWLDDYLKNNDVETIVVGEPKQMNNLPSESARFIEPFVSMLRKKYPTYQIDRWDERFTSVLAHRVILESGIGKKARQDKTLADRISAVIILQSYMESKTFRK